MTEVRVQCVCTAYQLPDLGEKLFKGDVLFLSKERADKSKDLAIAKQNKAVVCTEVVRCQEQRPAPPNQVLRPLIFQNQPNREFVSVPPAPISPPVPPVIPVQAVSVIDSSPPSVKPEVVLQISEAESEEDDEGGTDVPLKKKRSKRIPADGGGK
jgi:hypothetical protein